MCVCIVHSYPHSSRSYAGMVILGVILRQAKPNHCVDDG